MRVDASIENETTRADEDLWQTRRWQNKTPKGMALKSHFPVQYSLLLQWGTLIEHRKNDCCVQIMAALSTNI